MAPARLTTFAAVLAALAAAGFWLVESDGSSPAESRLQGEASSTAASAEGPGRARAVPPAAAEVRPGSWRARNGADREVPRLASAPTARTASAPPAAREGSGGSDRAPEDRSRVQRLSPSEIEQRWRSPDPDDRDAAVDGLEALADNALAVALLQQWIVDSPLRDAPAWDALDALDPQLKVDAGAGMLFSPGREQTAAVRLLAGDRWREAYQVLREILATTDANHESHGGLIARGLQSIGDGARPPDVGRELRHDIVADRPEG